MAKICVQCDKKIGMFTTPIEAIYCSYECRAAAKKAIEDNDKRAAAKKIADDQAAQEAAAQVAAESARAKADADLLATCPKCGAAWRFTPGAAAGGSGQCSKCSFTTEFTAIEKCPTCTCMSLVISATGAKCPRCKFRRS